MYIQTYAFCGSQNLVVWWFQKKTTKIAIQWSLKQIPSQKNIHVGVTDSLIKYWLNSLPLKKYILSFCKYILGVRKRSSNLASRLELGRLPLENYIKVQSLLYFARLHNNNINPLLKESFEVCKVLDSQNVYCWYTIK